MCFFIVVFPPVLLHILVNVDSYTYRLMPVTALSGMFFRLEGMSWDLSKDLKLRSRREMHSQWKQGQVILAVYRDMIWMCKEGFRKAKVQMELDLTRDVKNNSWEIIPTLKNGETRYGTGTVEFLSSSIFACNLKTWLQAARKCSVEYILVAGVERIELENIFSLTIVFA